MARKKTEHRLVDWHFVTFVAGKRQDGPALKESFDLKYGGMTFSEIRDEMQRIEQEYGDQFTEFKIEVDTDYDVVGDQIVTTFVLGLREETDEEYKARLDQEMQVIQAREQRERQLLEQLKKKYGD